VIDPMDVIQGISLDDLLEKTRGYTLPQKEIDAAVTYQREHFPRGFPECGTDALRFTLAAYTGQDQDIRFSVDRVEGYRKFCNKIWQAVLGFSLPHIEGLSPSPGVPEPATLADRWILARLAQVAHEVNTGLEEFRVGEVTQLLYHFFWDELCSWYIELQKPVLTGDDELQREAGRRVLRHALDVSLRLLHPLMPFVTEVLWQELPRSGNETESIMRASFPTAADGRPDDEALRRAAQLMTAIAAVRTVRSEYNVAPSTNISLTALTDDRELAELLESSATLLAALARVETLEVGPPDTARPPGCATAVIGETELLVPLKGIVDLAAERLRLAKERARADKEITTAEKKLGNDKFVSRAPVEVVARERQRMEDARARLVKIDEALARLEEVEDA
jgi:valyl-tRNA synthetase